MDIGSVLLKRGVIDSGQMQLLREQADGMRPDRFAIELGMASEEEILEVLADELGMSFVRLQDQEIDTDLLSQFPTGVIFRHSVLPIDRHNGSVSVATSDPFDLEALDELGALSGLHLKPVLACKTEILETIKRCLGVAGDTINELIAQRHGEAVELLEDLPEELGELAQSAQAPSVIRLVNQLLTEALSLQASDVHLEPQQNELSVRFRVDGLLQIQPVPPEINHFYSAIVTRLKIMSRLNIAEKRLPQDGRIQLRINGREVDVRVSIIPMIHGEGVVLRLLDKDRMVFNLQSVGMPPEISEDFYRLISMPHGIVLVTGPTGSGKTTTLYSALSEIKNPNTKIITVEDPVEYQIGGISQIQVHQKIGLNFAAGLRSILRHDPDVVLIGEIRDQETAKSAIQASLTGHLVFSTLHTNDAPGAYTRLVDMGVEPYLVASTVEGVLAQRLIRQLCNQCKASYGPDPAKLPDDFPNKEIKQLWRPVGCRACRDSGYVGRTGVYELLVNDTQLHRLCVSGASAGQIREYGLSKGMITLRQSGWQKVIAGITGVDEVLRITRGDR